MADIVITWPNNRPWDTYRNNCGRAYRNESSINFRVANLPRQTKVGERCYVVHRGVVLCYHIITAMGLRGQGEVLDLETGGHWPSGYYITRCAKTHELARPFGMKGFQNWRYLVPSHYSSALDLWRFDGDVVKALVAGHLADAGRELTNKPTLFRTAADIAALLLDCSDESKAARRSRGQRVAAAIRRFARLYSARSFNYRESRWEGNAVLCVQGEPTGYALTCFGVDCARSFIEAAKTTILPPIDLT